MSHLHEPLLFERLRRSERILIAGAGGGFDIYAGLPLALCLRHQGKEVHLANLSFSYLGGTNASWLAPHVACVTPDVVGEDGYFPERTLARWLRGRGMPATVYALEKVGVRPMRKAYQALCDHLAPDSVVVVDGGTDILI